MEIQRISQSVTGIILIGRITLSVAATAEAQDLRSGANNDARFEKSRKKSGDFGICRPQLWKPK